MKSAINYNKIVTASVYYYKSLFSNFSINHETNH